MALPIEAAPDLERLQVLRDRALGFRGQPERLDRRSQTPPGDPGPARGRGSAVGCGGGPASDRRVPRGHRPRASGLLLSAYTCWPVPWRTIDRPQVIGPA